MVQLSTNVGPFSKVESTNIPTIAILVAYASFLLLLLRAKKWIPSQLKFPPWFEPMLVAISGFIAAVISALLASALFASVPNWESGSWIKDLIMWPLEAALWWCSATFLIYSLRKIKPTTSNLSATKSRWQWWYLPWILAIATILAAGILEHFQTP